MSTRQLKGGLLILLLALGAGGLGLWMLQHQDQAQSTASGSAPEDPMVLRNMKQEDQPLAQ